MYREKMQQATKMGKNQHYGNFCCYCDIFHDAFTFITLEWLTFGHQVGEL